MENYMWGVNVEDKLGTNPEKAHVDDGEYVPSSIVRMYSNRINALENKIKTLVAALDKHNGTPCAEIHHKEEMDMVREQIERVKAELIESLKKLKDSDLPQPTDMPPKYAFAAGLWDDCVDACIDIIRNHDFTGDGNEAGLRPVPDKNAPSPTKQPDYSLGVPLDVIKREGMDYVKSRIKDNDFTGVASSTGGDLQQDKPECDTELKKHIKVLVEALETIAVGERITPSRKKRYYCSYDSLQDFAKQTLASLPEDLRNL
jgi:hypothetical protein